MLGRALASKELNFCASSLGGTAVREDIDVVERDTIPLSLPDFFGWVQMEADLLGSLTFSADVNKWSELVMASGT